jgi:hypothetical protein
MRNRNLPEGDISIWYHDFIRIATGALPLGQDTSPDERKPGVAMPEEPSQSRSF